MAISVPCVRFKQSGRRLYLVVVAGKQIYEFAAVPHVDHNEAGELVGYQRSEVKRHIETIRDYIDSAQRPIIPNSIVVAFNKPPKFTPAAEGMDVGTLEISENSAEIVDGQQRCAAIRDAENDEFPMPVVGFHVEDEAMKRETFVRVNSAKPLDRRFILALLPGINNGITPALEKKRIPAVLVDRLNRDADSPLAGLIKTATNPEGVIPDGALSDALGRSLTEGILYNYRTEEGLDVDAMLVAVKNFWGSVARVFKFAWDAGPKETRIRQNAAITALSGLMDEMGMTKTSAAHFRRELEKVAPFCHWTADSGDWNFGPDGVRPWNGVDNNARGGSFLKNYLVRAYKKASTANEGPASMSA
jgi:DNA sulfur modification protein DndB